MTDVVHRGSCHCGRVEFEVRAPADIEATQCNCSICTMTGFLHLIVGRDAFRLIRGEDDLATYTFNTGVAQHHFCRHCGVKSWYVPRSHPDGVSVNVNCLRPGTIASVTTRPFDGRNWEQNIAELSPISD
jgi:hypothetical protein